MNRHAIRDLGDTVIVGAAGGAGIGSAIKPGGGGALIGAILGAVVGAWCGLVQEQRRVLIDVILGVIVGTWCGVVQRVAPSSFMNITPLQTKRTREASYWFEQQYRRAEWSPAEREAWDHWSSDPDNIAEYSVICRPPPPF